MGNLIVKALKELLMKENTLLKKMVSEKFISTENLNSLREIQKQKKPLLQKLFNLKRQQLLESWKEVEELSLLNLENKELLINLIEIYRYH